MLEGIESWAALSVLGGGALVGYGIRGATRPVRPHHWVVPVKGLPPELDGFRILHLSDLHGRCYPADEDAVMRSLALDAPDVAAFTGDVLRRGDPEAGAPAVSLLGRIAASVPTFFCPGNHDYAPDGSVAARATLEGAGVRVLDDENAPGPRGTVFVGVGDPQTGRDDLDDALSELPAGFTVVMAHSPVIFSRIAARGLPLLLAGHTHGGQGRLPLVGSVWVPGQRGLFPRYDRGVFHLEDSTMVLTSGVGTSGPPFRFFVPPEFLVLTLRSTRMHG